MKVVFSAMPLKNNNKTRGVGVYTRELIAALRKHNPRDVFVESTGSPYTQPSDVVHYPFFDPFYLTLPWYYRRKTVITIHDLIPLKYPLHFKKGVRGRIKWQIQKLRARFATAIITDSASSALDIKRLIGIAESKIHVVPLAAPTVRTTLSVNHKVKKLYQLPENYILYVGDINWNKNVLGLIAAFNKVKSSDVHLVLVGKVFSDKPGIPEYLSIMDAIHKSPKSALIHPLGYIPGHYLGSLYSLATLYCQPSWDEGFGFPMLEAMALGCPVVSSDRGSLREVGGSAAVYFDPGSTELPRTLDEVLSDPDKRKEMASAGIAQAKRFSWDKVADSTMGVYRSL